MSLRTICLTTALAFAAPALLFAQPPAGAPPAGGPPPGGQRAPYVPKNLKVLPPDADIRAIMRGFTQALGVECEFCHAVNPDTHRPDFPSDANPMKENARVMIRMTGDVNTKYLTQLSMPEHHEGDTHPAIGCGTCHRGEKEPPAFVPPPRQPGNGGGAAPGAAAPAPAPRPGM